MTSFAAAEREAVSAAEKAERKVQLRDKVSYFGGYSRGTVFLSSSYVLLNQRACTINSIVTDTRICWIILMAAN